MTKGATRSHLDAAQGSSEERTKRTAGTESERESVTDAAMHQESAGMTGFAGQQGKAVRCVVGIDEVGRGCWAGPLVAAAVLLKRPINGLTDSKLLSSMRREKLSKLIHDNAFVGLGWVEPKVIDRIGLTAATSQAMSKALDQIVENYDEIIIDGHYNFLCARFDLAQKVRTMVKADSLIPAVSAASIVAKVARDDYMRQLASQFPAYQFEKHVGYGTKLHHDMLKLYGVCEQHRLSYKPIQALIA